MAMQARLALMLLFLTTPLTNHFLGLVIPAHMWPRKSHLMEQEKAGCRAKEHPGQCDPQQWRGWSILCPVEHRWACLSGFQAISRRGCMSCLVCMP